MKRRLIKIQLRRIVRARTCPRCGGTGTFLSGETCYYCKGTGSVDD